MNLLLKIDNYEIYNNGLRTRTIWNGLAIRKTLSGEVESFGKLISRYQGAVKELAYHLAGNFEDAEDIAQETFKDI